MRTNTAGIEIIDKALEEQKLTWGLVNVNGKRKLISWRQGGF